MIYTDKKSLRTYIKQILKNYKENFYSDSEHITKQITESQEYKNADTILSYMALPDEVNINIETLSKTKTVFIPKVKKESVSLDFFKYNKNNIKIGSYNIKEPDGTTELFSPINTAKYGHILVLTPGRAFTKEGKRLGRGKGYYDRFLINLKKNTLKERLTFAGICFFPQLMENIPTSDHDIKMDIIYTTK